MSKAAAGVVGFDEALEMVLRHAAELAAPATERVPLLACGEPGAGGGGAGGPRPAAVRSVDAGWICGAGRGVRRRRRCELPGRCGRASSGRAGRSRQGAAIEIMTGAPIPEGADAVVMVEHVERCDGAIRRVRRADDSQRREYCSARK